MVEAQEPASDVEAEPRALARRLGGKERVEDAGQDLTGNTWPIVHHPNHDPAQLSTRNDGDVPRLGNRVERIVDQVQPHLVELAAGREHAREI